MPSQTPKKSASASPDALTKRAPVVVVMGHIDHGKSTLLDYIRKANVVAGEAGGITQHVGAYQAESAGTDGTKKLFTFLDTPGHEAFGGIRKRGAAAADVAILVVSAEDGVKPQTLDALREIKAAGIPYIVAINKIDKPNADPNRTRQSLGENEIYVEGWGGDTPCVEISALNGTGIPELLDMIDLVAELADLKADPKSPATGIVIESELTRKGTSATLLIKNGTLAVGSFVVAGGSYASVRFIDSFRGQKLESAGPSTPVVLYGWNEVPPTGATFVTVDNKKDAERMANENAVALKKAAQNVEQAKIAADKIRRNSGGEDGPGIVTLPLIIKADVIGSLEGVQHELAKIKHDKVELKVVAAGIGEIGENDVKLAVSDPSIILLGFNVGTDKKAEAIIERSPVPIRVKTYKIIYELAQFVRDELTAKIPKEYIEEVTGRAKILAVFSKEKDKQVVGGKVQEGVLETGEGVRIMRREVEIGRGTIRELQQQKKRASEVREGYEFGTMIEAKIEIAVGDKIEAVRTVEKTS
ncbi:MAG TPA: translation initiation factor IF-2 [Candidatus Paceibacterota bacterium]